ncbi:MAG: D-Ala-D-Ala carboxypeptidase family metallohydrolase [Bacteroidales bacterium]|nr:D-Ala-D-Ala carboxypeptidase family metallohydrolase [Bacteroidales bacterium]MCQ2295214.1 D-Ala-D-Ala carboxypeptidase family metallohydrolase [Bacteroidales bacterium]
MKYFTIRELSNSATALRLGIDNTPSAEVMRNLAKLTDLLLDPARELWGKPLVVTSGYRCAKLNELVGGVAGSQHLRGCAADIVTLGNNRVQNYQLYQMIKSSSLPYDQLIAEKARCGGCNWLHISFAPTGKPRREALESR